MMCQLLNYECENCQGYVEYESNSMQEHHENQMCKGCFDDSVEHDYESKVCVICNERESQQLFGVCKECEDGINKFIEEDRHLPF